MVYREPEVGILGYYYTPCLWQFITGRIYKKIIQYHRYINSLFNYSFLYLFIKIFLFYIFKNKKIQRELFPFVLSY
ncbi:hypothetical protein BE24_0231 [Staphylococcus phage vB_SepM_BE24]|nr:hypothetical protein BE24_0231 [Staphylococcus phage vB_SepM_BE24]